MTLVKGRRGQFDVIVNGEVVCKRTGNFFTKVILRSGWPTATEVVSAVQLALQE